MLNSSEFSNRIKILMEYYELSASLFADKIGVQRSSISHILSGRNKPSLDFVLKITSKFKDLDIEWLLNGKGNFPKVEEKKIPKTPPTLFSNSEKNDKKRIQRIVVFYNDGTFEEYHK
ncbi:helix-turn-helix transcriptional regulator [Polaribacter sp. R77954]|uniref:helix-turn-helix transcriptional regulator n=1 Tax=Polaribacter sp. R77954 TaxID=3093870 RepID=UPI0037CC5861